MTPTLTVISWRDIPAQVIARAGRARSAAELSPRFQAAIDRAAMASGLSGSDAYLDHWHRESRDCGEDLDREVAAEIQRLETAYPQATLNRLAANGGQRPVDEEAIR